VAARASESDVRFLRDIAEHDADARFRAAAKTALDVLAAVPEHPSAAGTAPDHPVALVVRQTLLQDNGFPNDLRPLGTLDTSAAEDLLTDLVETLLGGSDVAHRALRQATRRLGLVVRAVTLDGTRVVTARLADPAQVARATDRPWVNGLLTLVRPRDILRAARRAAVEDKDRLNVLRWLAKVGPALGDARLVDPGTPGVDDFLYRIVALGHPRQRETRGDFDPPVVPPAAEPPVSRTAYPRLDAPDHVAPAGTFILKVGLAEAPDRRVVSPGPFQVPTGSFTLTATLVLDGFTLLGGAKPTISVEVTDESPYPYAVLEVQADDDPALSSARTILAIFQADGQPLGVASRSVLVQPEQVAVAQTEEPEDVDWVFDAASPRPDLEIYVVRGNDTAARSLLWHVRSKHHNVPQTTEPARVVLDENVAGTVKEFRTGIELRRDSMDLGHYLRGMGELISDVVHPAVWRALEAAAREVGGPPTVLLATWDAQIPWELAQVPSKWAEGEAYLGVQAIVGRWPYLERTRSAAPPATLRTRRMAVVSGVYPESIRLPEAEAEGAALRARYGAADITPTLEGVLGLLGGADSAEIVHIALHGKFDANGTQNGILMIDGTQYLDPVSIAGVPNSPVRLAFLNACQVGQGREMFGVYAGMAAALIRIGVTGVVAPLWKVDDTVAREIAEAFYPAVFAEHSPAAFLRAQRSEKDSGSTRLAYVFFGHPLLRVNWEGQDHHA
jgi:hypothetical protein